jgi:hypothetical protein
MRPQRVNNPYRKFDGGLQSGHAPVASGGEFGWPVLRRGWACPPSLVRCYCQEPVEPDSKPSAKIGLDSNSASRFRVVSKMNE